MKNMLLSGYYFISKALSISHKRIMLTFILGCVLAIGNLAYSQVTIISDNFESGFGNWNDGGNDCARDFNTLIGGNYNIRLRDNSGIPSSMTSDGLDLTPYGQINIRFSFYVAGYENGENFFMQYFPQSGGSFNIVTYTVGSTINGYTRYTTNLVMTIADYNFGANDRFRIRSNASDNGDRVYIDDITITGIPVPPNNDCSGAIALSINSSCITTTGTTEGATQSLPGCSGTADDDVWYSFVATNSEHTIRAAGSSLSDIVFQVFEGSCSGPSLICRDITGGNTPETTTLTGLTLGNQYYIRVYSYSNNTRNRGTFTICITEPCSPSNANGTTTLACPSVDAGAFGLDGMDISVNCSTESTVLEANYLDLGETTSYNVESIPYTPPFQFNCLANPVSVNTDDVWSDVINLPFDFCFYGVTYDKCVVGSNGVISFNEGLANQSSGWRFTENIPSFNNTTGRYYGASIYGVHHDVDPNIGGEIGYQLITLDTGCQALVAAWSDVPMYEDNSKLYSGMIVFYEDTNVIEIYIKEKNIDGNWNDGNATVGLQSHNNQGITAPGRNSLNTNWTATNEAWRFTPSGNSITTLKWYENSISAANEIIDPNNDGEIEVSPLETTTYYAEVTYNLCSGATLVELDPTTVTVEGKKTWNGSQSTAWENPNNWTPVGVPVDTNCITIPNTANDPIILSSTDGYGYNLSIEDGATLTQQPNASLTIEDAIAIEPMGDLQVNSGASIVQITDVNTNKNTGDAKVRRKVDGIDNFDYVYWSSPVDVFDVEDISPGTPSFAIYKWLPTVANGTAGNHGNWSNTLEDMSLGKGYIVRGLTGTTIANTAEFIGTLNNGKISLPISRGSYTGANYAGIGNTATDEDDNWNLLGNPYPSAISLNDFVLANPAIDGTLYFWQHLTPASSAIDDPFYNGYVYNYSDSEYLAANSLGSTPPGFNDFIAAGQGFFALMLDSAPTNSSVTFSNTMRGNFANDGFYRSATVTEDKHRIWLDLVNEENTALSTLIGFTNGATDGIDRLYDGYLISQAGNQFYSLVSDEKLTIQGKGLPFIETETIPLGYKTNNSGIFTISINKLDGLFANASQNIFLEDTELNIIHDLRANQYVFTTQDGVFDNRFILRFTNQSLSIKDQEIASDLEIKSFNETVNAKSGLSSIKSFELFDVTGRVIHKNLNVDNTDYSFPTHNLSIGTYFVKVSLETGAIVTKKVIIN